MKQLAVVRSLKSACEAALAEVRRVEKAHSALPPFEQEQAAEPELDRWYSAMVAVDEAIGTLAGLEAKTLSGVLAKAELVDQEDNVTPEQWELAVSVTRDLLAIGKRLKLSA